MLRTKGSTGVPKLLRGGLRTKSKVETPIRIEFPDLIDLDGGGWCEGNCRASRLCRTCREAVRTEALEWLRDLADDYSQPYLHLASMKVQLESSANAVKSRTTRPARPVATPPPGRGDQPSA